MSSPASTLRVGVVGTGLMGEIHARNLRWRVPDAQLVAISDANGDRAVQVAAQFGVAAFDDGNELINSADVDAVVVASPDNTHADYAIACVVAGKPVLCEKPLAETQTRAQEVLDAEHAAGRRLVQVGFMRSFDAAHRAIHEAVTSGQIGQPVLFRGTHVNPAPIGVTDVDRAISQSLIHDINSARWFLGGEVAEVVARWIPLAGTDGASCHLAAAMLTFDNGALAIIDVNIEGHYGYAVTAEVVGTTGTLATITPSPSTLLFDGRSANTLTPNWAVRFADAYLAEAEAWVNSIHTGAPVGASAYDGYIANVIADACITSARTGHAVSVARSFAPGLPPA